MREVVEDLAAREGIDEASARERALDTLRLVAARRAELAEHPEPPEHPDGLAPARRRQLERAALVRLWLSDVFEPAHEADDIPARVIEANMTDPRVSQRFFHPQVWVVCQALVVPAAKEGGRHVLPPSEGEPAERWRSGAEQAFAPFVARAKRLEDELLAAGDCSLLGRLVQSSEQALALDGPSHRSAGEDAPPELPESGPSGPELPESDRMTLRFEQFGFAPDVEGTLDPTWVERVRALGGTGLVGPFATRFGIHLVLVVKIEPASLADGSHPPDELARRREAFLREQIRDQWRAEQLALEVQRIRDDRVVRVAGAD